MSSSSKEVLNELFKLLKLLYKKIEEIEVSIEEMKEEIQNLKKGVEKILKSQVSVKTSGKSITKSKLVDYIKDKVYLETREIKAKQLLKKLINNGELILLRDDVLNLEVVTAPDVIKRIIEKLPVQVDKVDEVFNEREYQLLKILNRLGYVLVKDGQYVKTDLVKELIARS